MNEREKKIKEQRTIEATKKNLMGMNGKFGIILRSLGQPIMSHSSYGSNYSVNYLEDPLQIDDDDEEIPTMDIEGVSEPESDEWHERPERKPTHIAGVGWVFDGLRQGAHLEIKYINNRKELNVYYKGYLVFKEIAGELEAYGPFDEWENKIDRFYNVAKELSKEQRSVQKKEQKEMGEKLKKSWWAKTRLKWGL